MAVRLDQVVVIVDDFSYRSLGSDNVYYYDAGYLHQVRLYDYAYNGYGDMDEFEYLYLDEPGGFYPIDPVDFTDPEGSYYSLDLFDEGTIYDSGLDPSGNAIYYGDYLEFTGDQPTPDETVLHGDWILDSFLNQLDSQSTDIILIDVDQWSGDVLDTHLQELFLLVDTPYVDGQVTQLQLIVDSWIAEHNSEEEFYSFSLLSYSIAGVLPDLNESIALDWMESQYTIVVQASPNVGQGEYNWGGLYQNVINVAAWNVDEDGNSLYADPSTDETLDIFAYGYVVHDEWGSTFGTSFATPRVAAEMANELDIILEDVNQQLLSGELTEQELLESEPLPYADIVDIMLSTISSPVLVDFDNGWISDPINVLSDDVANNLFPATVPRNVGGSGVPYTTVETVYLVIDVVENGDGSQTRTYLDQAGVEWSVYYIADDNSYSEILTDADGNTIEKQALWNEDGSHVATKSSSYKDRIGNTIDKVWRWDSSFSTETIIRTDTNTGQRSVSRYQYDELGAKSAIYADTLINEDLPFSYDASTNLLFQGVGSDRTYSARLDGGSALPEWLGIDVATGQFTGTPDNGDVNLLEVVVTATDGAGESADVSFYLIVNNINDAPTLGGDFTGAVTIGSETNTASGALVGSDVDEYPYIWKWETGNWTDTDYSIDETGRDVTTHTNALGDVAIITMDGDWDSPYTRTEIITLSSGGQWSRVVVDDGDGTITATTISTLGDNYTYVRIDNPDGTKTADIIGDVFNHGLLYTDVSATEVWDPSGIKSSFSGTATSADGSPVIGGNDGADEDGYPYLIVSTSGSYGIDSVFRDEEGLYYTIRNQQGTYGTLALDTEANWIYTLDNSDPDIIALAPGQEAVDSFTIDVSDGIDTISQQIDVSVTGGDEVAGTSSDDILQGTDNTDIISPLEGADVVYAKAGNDTITLIADAVWTSSYIAKNIGNDSSIGTNQKINLDGLSRFSDMIDGGNDIDTLNLTTGNDAFFVDDVYSDHHESLTLSATSRGIDSTARIVDLEAINAGGGNDIVDLTSNDFILSSAVTLNGEVGDDTLWGSNGDDTIDGGDGNDTLFGGTGRDTLTGGAGSDTFQFTATAGGDVVADFDINEDVIQLYYQSGENHSDADLSLVNGVLEWDAGVNNVVIDLSATLSSSNLADVDSLITFVEIA